MFMYIHFNNVKGQGWQIWEIPEKESDTFYFGDLSVFAPQSVQDDSWRGEACWALQFTLLPAGVSVAPCCRSLLCGLQTGGTTPHGSRDLWTGWISSHFPPDTRLLSQNPAWNQFIFIIWNSFVVQMWMEPSHPAYVEFFFLFVFYRCLTRSFCC